MNAETDAFCAPPNDAPPNDALREDPARNPARNPADNACEPCRGGVPPMTRAAAEARLAVVPGWTLAGGAGEETPLRLRRSWTFSNFAAAQSFVLQVGDLCEAEGHHAEIAYGWGHATVEFWTHKIAGLHENDFIMAAKTDRLTI